MAGPRTVAFLGFAVIAGLVQSYVDILLSAYLSLFVSSLGLIDSSGTPGLSLLPHGSPRAISLGLLGAGIARSAFQLLVAEFSILGMEAVVARLRLLTTKQLLDVGRKRSPTPAADMALRLSEVYPRASSATAALIQLCASLLQALGLFAYAFVVARREALAGVAGLGLLAVVVWMIGRRIHHYTAVMPDLYGRLASGLERISRNQLLIRILRTEVLEFPRLKAQIVNYYRRAVAAQLLSSVGGALPQTSGVILVVCIIYVSQSNWHTQGPVLLSFIYVFIRLVQALALSASQFTAVSTYGVFLRRALADFATETDRGLAEALSLNPGESGLPRLERESVRPLVDEAPPAIELRSASFRYDGSDTWALRGFSLSVLPGDHVGVTGPSGCGKTTLVQLILGVLAPNEGTVLVGERSTSEVQPVEHIRIGYVGAEPFLFEGTLEENVRYGASEEATVPGIWGALTAARIAEFVRSLPDGLQSRVGEAGEGLSAGQKQRISLARALLGRPQLLVLDEATSNIDNATETEIAEALDELGKSVTVVIVAHRPGILARCGHVVRMSAP